jgi:S-adenosylmethionine synthetase
MRYLFTSESASEGHPDKVCDLVADSVLDAYLARDPDARVGCEVLYKGDLMVIAGEITAPDAVIDVDGIARQALRDVGYVAPEPYNDETVEVRQLITEQSREIRQASDVASDDEQEHGASDQGIVFGMASNETPELMPLPILLAHRLSAAVAGDRHAGVVPWLRPDGKTAVTVAYEDEQPVEVTTVLVSAQHRQRVSHGDVEEYVRERLAPRVLGPWLTPSTRLVVNPLGSFTLGGPEIDCGVTGRKIIADTYGGMGRIGGGALSGKDPSKLDRAGAYFCRWVARQVVTEGIAQKVEIQVAYAFGLAHPVSIAVNTFGTGDADKAQAFVAQYDFRPRAIVEHLGLRRPIYRQTANYGHFGRSGVPWET